MSKANVTLGVPRVKEIIHAVANPKAPTMNVYLDSRISSDPEKVLEMMQNIQGTRIKDLLVSEHSNVYYEKDTLLPPFATQFNEDRWWVRLFYTVMFNGATDPSIFSYHIIRLVFDENKLQRRGLTVNSIATHLNKLLGDEMLIINSDTNGSHPVIRLRLIYDKPPTGDDNREHEKKFLKQYLRQHLKEFILCGAPNITKAYVESTELKTYNEETHELESKQEWYLITEGTDLKRVLNWTGVDHRRTISNNPLEVLEVLGIEATTQSIISEIQKVMKFYGIGVNYRHLSLLANTMTGRGAIMAINRHGINRTDASPFKKCTFEETVDMLMDAAKDCVYDQLKAVSSNIIVGKVPELGTGMFQLKWDGNLNRKYSTPSRNQQSNPGYGYRRPSSFITPTRENKFEDDELSLLRPPEDTHDALQGLEQELETVLQQKVDTDSLFDF
jgi:DNA-directed RNA polymerase II subunit RPB1